MSEHHAEVAADSLPLLDHSSGMGREPKVPTIVERTGRERVPAEMPGRCSADAVWTARSR